MGRRVGAMHVNAGEGVPDFGCGGKRRGVDSGGNVAFSL